jgi:hypothetical protein
MHQQRMQVDVHGVHDCACLNCARFNAYEAADAAGSTNNAAATALAM